MSEIVIFRSLIDLLFFFAGTREEVFLERSGKLSGNSYILDIRPLVVMKNCLPVTIHYAMGSENLDDKTHMQSLEPGQSGHLRDDRSGRSYLHLKIFEFRQKDWTCAQQMESELPELSMWRFTSTLNNEGNQDKMDIGINTVISHGTHVLSIYAPFWMINKTGKMLAYKGQDPQNVIYHDPDLGQDEVPMMFSFIQKRFMGKRKASIRIENNTSWSDPFTLDTIEDAGKVSCKAKNTNEVFHVGVNINMSKSSLTKIITFTPFYLIYNTSELTLEILEIDTAGEFYFPDFF